RVAEAAAGPRSGQPRSSLRAGSLLPGPGPKPRSLRSAPAGPGSRPEERVGSGRCPPPVREPSARRVGLTLSRDRSHGVTEYATARTDAGTAGNGTRRNEGHEVGKRVSILPVLLAVSGCHQPPAPQAAPPVPVRFREVTAPAGIHFALGHKGRHPLSI